MDLLSKDITIFTFTLPDKVGNSMLYRLCEQSWHKVLPGAKIIKFNIFEEAEKYSDLLFYKVLKDRGINNICYLTDSLRIIKSMEIPNSIYMDSDIYLLESPMPRINQLIKNNPNNLDGLCYYYFNNGINKKIQALYNLYTGKTSKDRNILLSASNLVDATMWSYALKSSDHSSLSYHFHYSTFSKLNYLIVDTPIKFNSEYWFNFKNKDYLSTIIFIDPDIKVWSHVVNKDIYITSNISFMLSVVQNFCEARLSNNSRTVKFSYEYITYEKAISTIMEYNPKTDYKRLLKLFQKR